MGLRESNDVVDPLSNEASDSVEHFELSIFIWPLLLFCGLFTIALNDSELFGFISCLSLSNIAVTFNA